VQLPGRSLLIASCSLTNLPAPIKLEQACTEVTLRTYIVLLAALMAVISLTHIHGHRVWIQVISQFE
jgi:hypothetical protein